ncbi:MAG TPA: alpha/beta hydrolase [Solirubrobacteraceae bacterium]|nr:alpha/beta hydrolase [Solirubrobacteraceae bacterium]
MPEAVELAFDRHGEGGFPLLLVHGWPETRRIWARNVEPLAAAGFEVIVPDLRGFGDSPLAEHYDLAAHAHDLKALLDRLGHDRCAAAGGDLGGGVIVDLGLRFPGLVERQVIFNSILPVLPDLPEIPRRTRAAADYFIRQGTDADGLAAELDTPERRRRYIATFYGSRFWASPGTFTQDDVDWHTEPFADADKLRAGFGNYESAFGSRPISEAPRFFEPSPVETLILYGPDDHVIWPDFPERATRCFPNRVGPFVVTGAGHFLQWERAEVLNGAVRAFLRDLAA